MKGRGDWRTRVEEKLELTGEPVYGAPLVEIYGQGRVLIENHQGVLQYGDQQICVRVRFGRIVIHGCGLELAQMTRQQLVIRGKIHRVCLTQRGER